MSATFLVFDSHNEAQRLVECALQATGVRWPSGAKRGRPRKAVSAPAMPKSVVDIAPRYVFVECANGIGSADTDSRKRVRAHAMRHHRREMRRRISHDAQSGTCLAFSPTLCADEEVFSAFPAHSRPRMRSLLELCKLAYAF